MTIARVLAALAAGAALGVSAPAASADELRATRGQPLDEISHTVTVRIADGVATYTVQRQFQNRGKVADQADLAIDLPTGAAATGLRIRVGRTWHAGELLDSEVAAARYRELTGAGVHDPKDPAILYWRSSSELYLQIFPVAPGGVSTVEYTLTAPVRYAAGRYWLTYPRAARAADATGAAAPADPDPGARRLVDPVITVQPAWAPPAGGIVIDGRPAQPGAPLALTPPARHAWRFAAMPSAPDADADAPSADADADTTAPSPGTDPDADLPQGTSVLDIPAAPRGELRYSLARVHVELQHPSYSDLSLALVTPDGVLVPIADGAADTLGASAALEVRLPEPTRAAGRWRLLVRNRSSADTGTLLRWSLALADRTFASTDTPVFVPDADGQRRALIRVDPPATAPGTLSTSGGPGASGVPWLGRLGRVVASDDHAFSRLELDAAPRLSAAPRRAQVVFVLDASYSIGPLLLDAQLAIVRAYLAHVPDAELEIVAVRRTARRVFGRFVPAAEAPRLLDAAVRAGALALGNGSALDDGARLAAALLAGRPGPQRVVLATDELVRWTLSDAALLAPLAQLAPSAVVHVVVPGDGGGPVPTLARDDSAPLAALATGHHGIFARLSGLDASAPALATVLAPVVLELVRPTRIDALAITGKSPLSLPDALPEGQGLRLFEGVPTRDAPSALSLTGKLWSDPVRLELAASPAFSTASAAFVFGGDQHGQLSEDEQRTVALAARAVSPVTSYLAIEPGVRPSKIGLEDESWLGQIGTIGIGSIGSTSRCGGVRLIHAVDLEELIPTEACVRKHGTGEPWAVKLKIELTRDEIVDVDVLDGTDPLAACLVEAAWSVHLPPDFDRERDSRVITLSGP